MCLSDTTMSCIKTSELIWDVILDAVSWACGTMYKMGWVLIPSWEGTLRRLPGHWDSLLYSKPCRDYLFVNNGITAAAGPYLNALGWWTLTLGFSLLTCCAKQDSMLQNYFGQLCLKWAWEHFVFGFCSIERCMCYFVSLVSLSLFFHFWLSAVD